MKYICVCGFAVEMFDDDGFSLEEYTTVENGDVYELAETDFRLVGGRSSVRLESKERGDWLELTQDFFQEHFAPAEEVINESH